MELVNRAVNFALSLQRRPGDVVASEHWISSGFATTDFDMQKFHFGGNVAGGLNVAHLMLPQNLELGRLIYDAAANAAGWRTGTGEVRANTTGMILAKELGDDVAYQRLRAAAEREYEPKVFGDHQEQFGWFFGNKKRFPAVRAARCSWRPRSLALAIGRAPLRGDTWTSTPLQRSRGSSSRRSAFRKPGMIRQRHDARGDVRRGARETRFRDTMARHESARRCQPHISVEWAIHALRCRWSADDRADAPLLPR